MGKKIVVIAEHADNRIKSITYEIITFAERLQQATSLSVEVIVIGAQTMDLALEISNNTGLDVTVAQILDKKNYSAELYSGVLTEILTEISPEYVCVPHTAQGLDYAKVRNRLSPPHPRGARHPSCYRLCSKRRRWRNLSTSLARPA